MPNTPGNAPRITFRPASRAFGPAHWQIQDKQYVNSARLGTINAQSLLIGIVATVVLGASEAVIHDTWEETTQTVPLGRLSEYVGGISRHPHGARVLAATAGVVSQPTALAA